MTQHGDIAWSELLTPDPAAARAFFEDIAGWTVDEMDQGEGMPPYLVCSANGRPVAGIMDLNAPDLGGAPPGWSTYLHIDDVDAACAKTTALGGTVIRAPFDVPNAGRIAMIADPTGTVVGLMTPE